MENLRDSEKQKLFGKLSEVLGKKTFIITKVDKEWTKQELAKKYNVVNTRFTEMEKRFTKKKYLDRFVSIKNFFRLIDGGFMSFDEIVETGQLTKKEQKYLEEALEVHEDTEHTKYYHLLKEAGKIPSQVLKKEYEKDRIKAVK